MHASRRASITTVVMVSAMTAAMPHRAHAAADGDMFAYNRALGRGINMGNALEAPAQQSWGVELRAEYFALIAAAGFTSVRLPVRWSDHAATSAPYTIHAEFFRTVDTVLGWALSNKLHVVLNMHHYHELSEHPGAHRTRFLALWKQIASHYRGAPDRVCFEVLNEPCRAMTAALWNELIPEAIQIIRATNPRRPLIIGPVEWNSMAALPQLVLPENDRRLIATVHYYNPFAFTHQGAEWVEHMQDTRGIAWQGTSNEQAAVQADFLRVAEWARTHKRPVYMGEFGAYDKADMASRARWAAYVAREAERHGMSWAYWEFCAGFGVYDRAAARWRTELLHALMPAGSGAP